jgi:ribosome-associated toxin RatA of RatAB toxin-antitoxin module
VSLYGEARQADIDARPEECYAALIDFEHVPDWQGSVRSARVLERDEAGRGSVVEFEVDAKVRTVRYRIRQIHEPPHRLASEYLGGDFRAFAGEWRFEPLPGGRTRAHLELAIDPGRLVPRPIRALISEAVMVRALADLKVHVEAGGRPAP